MADDEQASVPRANSNRPGPVGSLVGPYRIGKALGVGAMANVVEAIHEGTGERVALKILNAELVGRSDIVARFVREGRALQRLRHPNIVRVIDHGTSPTGESWIAMEHLHAVTLDALLRERPLAPKRAVRIAVDVARALAAVHGAGIVHRDIKPENVLVVDAGTRNELAKLIDFGVAKVTKAEMGEGGVAHTRVGSVLGSLAFASPEQLAGQPVDARTDVFALAVTLYEALTGELPFEGGTVGEQMRARETGALIPLRQRRIAGSKVPHSLEKFMTRALAFDREKRPEDGWAALEELTRILNELSPSSVPIPLPAAQQMKPRRRKQATVRKQTAIEIAIKAVIILALFVCGLLAARALQGW